MLQVLAIIVLVLAIGAGVLILFAAGMSDAPTENPWRFGFMWPFYVGVALAIALFVLHHWLRHASVSW